MARDNLEIYNKVRAVPDSAQKPISAGRLKGFTDINPMWRIKTLTEIFGPAGEGWTYKIINREILPAGDTGERAAIVEIELRVKDSTGSWGEPITGIGGSMYIAIQKGKQYVDDECYKKALTDAIGVAAKALGVGADVYWQKDASKYNPIQADDEAAPAAPKPVGRPKLTPEEEKRKAMAVELLRKAGAKGYNTDDVLAYCGVERLGELTELKLQEAMTAYDMMEAKHA